MRTAAASTARVEERAASAAAPAPVVVVPSRPTAQAPHVAVPSPPSSRRLEDLTTERAVTRGWTMIPLIRWSGDRDEALLFWTATTTDNTQVMFRHRRADGSWEEPEGPFPSHLFGDRIAALATQGSATIVDRAEGAPQGDLAGRLVSVLGALREAVDRNDGPAIASNVRAVADLYCFDRVVQGSVIVFLAPVVLEGARPRLLGHERHGDREWFRIELAGGQGRQRYRKILPVPAQPVEGAPDRWSFCI
ncbi:MAG: hypothetical protein HYY06_30690 [Deltaproteobacteria bacterium]|nr:hypothetical protein [Deltaproteobacteria bacterium]